MTSTTHTTTLTATCPPPPPDDYCTYEWDYELESWYCYESPILIPTGKSQAYKLTSVEEGVVFDLDADGSPDRTAWTAGGEEVAFLAWDRNGNSQIDDGSELFGNHTWKGARNGFEALAEIQFAERGVRRGSISEEDGPLYAKLLLWTDRNHNGVSEPAELEPFSKYFSDIGLAFRLAKRKDGHGNLFIYEGHVTVRTGPGRNPAWKPDDIQARMRKVYDVYFKVQR